jgi:hypothetical protein
VDIFGHRDETAMTSEHISTAARLRPFDDRSSGRIGIDQLPAGTISGNEFLTLPTTMGHRAGLEHHNQNLVDGCPADNCCVRRSYDGKSV